MQTEKTSKQLEKCNNNMIRYNLYVIHVIYKEFPSNHQKYVFLSFLSLQDSKNVSWKLVMEGDIRKGKFYITLYTHLCRNKNCE